MLLALLPWLACAGAHDTGEAQPATLQRVEVVIPAGETAEIVPLLPVQAIVCSHSDCVSYEFVLVMRLGRAEVTAPADGDLHVYWLE